MRSGVRSSRPAQRPCGLDHMRFNGKVVLVTGAGRGIGWEIARSFAEAGASVALIDIDDSSLHERLFELERGDTRAIAVPADVADNSQVQAAVREVIDRLGDLHILVNNAAIFNSTPLLEIKQEEWDRLMAVNVRGMLNCAQAAVRHMMNGQGGRIVNLASLAGKRGRTIFGDPGESTWAAYAVSKASIIALTKAMAYEWAPHNIYVNAVAPGLIDVGQLEEGQKESMASRIPVGRVGRAGDVASAVLFLASEENSYITGEVLDVNGGVEMD